MYDMDGEYTFSRDLEGISIDVDSVKRDKKELQARFLLIKTFAWLQKSNGNFPKSLHAFLVHLKDISQVHFSKWISIFEIQVT